MSFVSLNPSKMGVYDVLVEELHTWSTRLLSRVNPYQAPNTVESLLFPTSTDIIMCSITLPEDIMI
jgi:hypothetical protein